MICLYRNVFFILPVVLFFFVTVGLAQQKSQPTEEAFKATIDEWMMPYRNERADALAQWFRGIEQVPASARDHAVYASLRDFYQTHRSAYRQLREASLRRYGPRPLSYPGYQAVDIRRLWEGEVSLDSMLALYQDIGNIRTINVEATSSIQGIVSGLILNYMTSEQKRTISELSRLLGFGNRLFADQAGPATWNIAYVNRCYVVNYQWNIDNNRISISSILVHDGTRQQPDWLPAASASGGTPAQQLYQQASGFRWKLYDDTKDESDYINERQLAEKLWHFVNSHRAAYVQVRGEALSRKPAWKSGWQAGYQPADTLQDDVLYSLAVQSNTQEYTLRPDVAFLEFDCYMVVERFKMYVLKTRVRNDLATSWLTGDAVHTRKLEGNRWEIQCFHQQYALTYQWDIGTDHISQLQCWKKQ